MEPIVVYIGKKQGFMRSTLVVKSGKISRYILGDGGIHSTYPDNFKISLDTWKLTDIKTQEELEVHFLTQKLLGGT